ncbi:MAG: hypothetical protein VYD19_07885 [Myxococcota bacterium]|nr:hypothetical protein [Myxococcota bacterium]
MITSWMEREKLWGQTRRGAMLRALCAALFFTSALSACEGEESAREKPSPSDRGALSADRALGDADRGRDQGTRADQRLARDQSVACEFPADCPDGDCVEGQCHSQRAQLCESDEDCEGEQVCLSERSLTRCVEPCVLTLSCPQPVSDCRNNSLQCPLGMVCLEDRCVNACATDLDCVEAGHCVEGVCEPFPAALFSSLRGAAESPAGVTSVGIGIEAFDFPVGVSLGAYGGRAGARTPYAVSLGASDRVFERQDVRALALDDGGDRVILLRLPLAWTSDFLRTLIALELQVLTRDDAHPDGVNYIDQLLLFASHSHSQPTRFWNLVPGLPFGSLGYGQFSYALARRYARSAARAAYRALQDLRPARLGHVIADEIDPAGEIHSDRRSASPPFVDDRILLLRVDELDGRPRAALVGFAIHGTFLDKSWVTGDAPGGIERIMTERLSQAAGHPVPVIFANGNAGDVSPRGDRTLSQGHGKLQRIGQLLAARTLGLFTEISSAEGVPFRYRTTRTPLSYDGLGYQRQPAEFADAQGNPYLFGGFRCLSTERGWEEPAYERDVLNCAFNLIDIYRAPVLQFAKTSLSALQIGDLILTTLPGEPSSALGVRLGEEVVAAAAARGETVESFNIGYAMDFLFYLLDEEDWLHGGYEASMQLWGWRIGRALVQRSVSLVERLLDETPDPVSRQPKPTWWPRLVEEEPPLSEDPRGAGTRLESSPGPWQRGALITLSWIGGHPGVDLPQLQLERRGEGDTWALVRDEESGLPLDDSGFHSLLIYEGDFEGNQRWSTRWELPFSLPIGEYRLCARGESGLSHATDALTGYEVCGEAATVEAVPLVVHEQRLEAGRLTVNLGYPQGPSNDDGQSAFERLAPSGHWLRHEVEATLPESLRRYALLLNPPVTGPLTLRRADDALTAPLILTPTLSAAHPRLVLSRSPEGVEREERVNAWIGGALEVDLSALGLAFGDRLQIEDAWGNSVEVEIEEREGE